MVNDFQTQRRTKSREDVISNVSYNDVAFNENEDCHSEVYHTFTF